MTETEFVNYSLREALEVDARWRALGDSAVDPNPFFELDFLEPFQGCAPNDAIRICVVRERESGSFRLLCPFFQRPRGYGVTAARSYVTEYGPLGAPLMSAAATSQDIELFFAGVMETLGVKLVVLPYVRRDGAAFEAISRMGRMRSWQVGLAQQGVRAGHEAGRRGARQAVSGKRGKELRRQLRRLGDCGPVELISRQERQEVIAAFERFLLLEAAGWKGRKGTALLSDARTADFARAFIARSAGQGRIRIDELLCSGKVLASLVLLRRSGMAFAWKVTFDENFSRYSPGAQVTRYAMEQNLLEGGERGADSLAAPGHPMITPLWRGRAPFATVIASQGRFACLRLKLIWAWLETRDFSRAYAKRLWRRFAHTP